MRAASGTQDFSMGGMNGAGVLGAATRFN